MEEKRDILSFSLHELSEAFQSRERAFQIYKRFQAGIDVFDDPTLPKTIGSRLQKFVGPIPTAHEFRPASDGTRKFTVRFLDGRRVESVLIPTPRRTTLCISSQVGCQRACTFCRTGQMGLVRNLKTSEILWQVAHAQRIVRTDPFDAPLRNVVFMGMGEPLDNWKAVQSAIDVLTSDRGFGFAPAHVSVSTVAPSARAVTMLAGLKARIAFSLHSPTEKTRRRLVPTQKDSVEAIVDSFRSIFRDRKDPLFIEMTLIENVNDSVLEAEATAKLFANFPTQIRFNLIPMNPIPGTLLNGSSRIEAFRETLRGLGFFVSIRSQRGDDELAACGQLATTLQESS